MARTPERENSFEMRFILSALQIESATSGALFNDLLRSNQLRWDVVLRLASWHGVVSLLAKRLQRVEAAAFLQPEVRRLFEHRARECAFRSMSQMAALAEIQLAMNEAGIAAIAWKGPALSQDLYGSYALRASSDLDFLLPGSQMANAACTLARHGFITRSEWVKTAAAERATQMNCELQMIRARDQMPIELHNEIMPRLFGRGMSIERCIKRARWMELDERSRVRVLAPDDLLISLCAHGAKHGWERLKWVCDIAAYLARYRDEVAWSELLASARNASALEAVLGGVRVAVALLGATQPEQVRQCAREKAAVRKAVTAAVAQVGSGSIEPRGVKVALRDALDAAGTRPARARYLLRRSLTIGAMDVESFTLPAKLSALYYPLRIVRVMRKAARSSLSRPGSATNPSRL